MPGEEQPQPPVFGFRKILPKKRTALSSPTGMLSNAQLTEIVRQVDVFAQLLMQACLFMPQRPRQMEALNLVQKLILEKKHLLFLNGLRGYEVYLVDLKFGNSSLKTLRQFIASRFDAADWAREGAGGLAPPGPQLENLLTFEFAPQISALQCPALEAQKLLEEAVRKDLPKDRKAALLHELVPLFQKSYVPVFGEAPRSGTNKFTAIDDALLLNGLLQHSSRNFPAVQAQFLPHKSVAEMRNRYKNLTRQKAPHNPIKGWKLRESAPLTAEELRNLEKGRLWFGPHNLRLIARYFLYTRSEGFLAQEAVLLNKRAEPPTESPEAVELAGLSYASDFCAEDVDAARENQQFMEFLRSFLSNNRSIADIVARPAQSCRNLSMNLSEAKLSLRSFSKRSKRVVELKRDSVTSTNLRLIDDQLHFSANQITSSDVRHAFVDEKAFDAKIQKTTACSIPGVLRLVPTFRELQIAAATVLEKKNFSIRNNCIYDKLMM